MDLLKKIKSNAKKYGLDKDYFFTTTLERYEEQLNILEELKKELATGMFVKKTYVKNRENVYSNPAIADYNKTADSANKTAMVLLKMIDRAKKETTAKSKNKEKKDPLTAILGD